MDTFILGDCLEVMKEIPDGSVDMILCDLPYGATACKWDEVIPFGPLWEAYKRVVKGNGAIVLTASQPFTSALVMSNPKWFKHEWIWEKSNGSNFSIAKNQPMKCHENILIFSSGTPQYNPQKTKNEGNRERKITPRKQAKTGIYGDILRSSGDYDKTRFPRSVQFFASESRNNQFVSCYNLHPTQKPVALFEYLIKTYSNEGDTVLDNCAGSGTTAIAALRTNRKYICIEKDPDYYAAATKRIQQYRSQLKLAF